MKAPTRDRLASGTTSSAADIGERLRTPPTVPEAAVLMVVVTFAVAVFPGVDSAGVDWQTYVNAVDGRYVTDTEGLAYYYPYWWLFPLELLVALGDAPGFAVLGVLNIAGFWFAARVFGTQPIPVIVAFVTLRGIFFGTLTGLLAAAAAGMWWAMHRDRPVLAGVLGAFAMAKLQWGAPLVLAIWLLAPASWPARLRAMAAGAVVAVASLAVYGFWPADVYERARDFPPAGNDSLWDLIGPVVLLLWIPALLLPMSRSHRLVAVVATAMLAAPYVQHYDMGVVFAVHWSWVGLFSWVGRVLFEVSADLGNTVMTVLPLPAYLSVVVPATRAWRAGREASSLA